MSLLDDLAGWKRSGAISSSQHDVIAAVVRKERFSVFLELTALLYVGVVALVGGVGWTIQTHFARLGDAAILSGLTILLAGALTYCFLRVAPYSHDRRESSGFAFDYVLYFGCLVFGVELGFIEFRFHLLKDSWDHYLLLSSIVYFVLAYRFDNQLVLSLALSTLAGWFGFRLTRLPWIPGSLRIYAIAYAATLAALGVGLSRAQIKAHFLLAYLHVAANVALAAFAAGVIDRNASIAYLLGLTIVSGISIAGGLRFAKFAFVIYGVAYSYVGLSDVLLRDVHSFTTSLTYVVTSATAIVVMLVVLARRFGRTV
jgi:hypothetical protein